MVRHAVYRYKFDMMCGKPIKPGDTYFVDDYNHEFSRDIEPVARRFR